MRRIFVNGRVLLGDALVEDHFVLVEGERIEAIGLDADQPPADATVVNLRGQLLLPGFIDIQVNGGGGILFNDSPTVEGIRTMAAAHRRYGTTGFLPTLISDELPVVERAIHSVESAIAAGVPGVLGIHIEGPFLSKQYKGVHDATRLLSLDIAGVSLLSSLRRGKTVVTVAPEITTPDLIQQLTDAGVIVCAGHTSATYEQIGAARRHGLHGFTHLFNAMSPLSSREPGTVGAALADPDAWCGIIVDGRHVNPVVLKIALRAKRHDRFMLITDAMPCVGTDLRSFQLQGRTITVQDDYCLDERGTLAGTALDMARCVRNAIALLDLPTVEAVRMASEYPARFLGLDAVRGHIAAGRRADFVVADEGLNVMEVWRGGCRSEMTGSPP
jgi:N-acetylglucosamine-6-phosphate deacetylase